MPSAANIQAACPVWPLHVNLHDALNPVLSLIWEIAGRSDVQFEVPSYVGCKSLSLGHEGQA